VGLKQARRTTTFAEDILQYPQTVDLHPAGGADRPSRTLSVKVEEALDVRRNPQSGATLRYITYVEGAGLAAERLDGNSLGSVQVGRFT